MSSISPAPQGEVGQSHLSRGLGLRNANHRRQLESELADGGAPSEDSTNIVVSGNGWTFSIAAGVLVAGSSYAIHVHAIDTTGFSSWHAGDASLMVQVHASLLASRACSPGV
jgi:hypothetical protein